MVKSSCWTLLLLLLRLLPLSLQNPPSLLNMLSLQSQKVAEDQAGPIPPPLLPPLSPSCCPSVLRMAIG